jgi:hypothetical protein
LNRRIRGLVKKGGRGRVKKGGGEGRVKRDADRSLDMVLDKLTHRLPH